MEIINIFLFRYICCCFNDMESQYQKINDSYCNYPCNGDPSRTCGGQYLSLFNVINSISGGKYHIQIKISYFINFIRNFILDTNYGKQIGCFYVLNEFYSQMYTFGYQDYGLISFNYCTDYCQSRGMKITILNNG